MKKRIKRTMGFFIRSLDAGSYLETFFVSAISSLLISRTVVELSGHWQLGGSHFHIAHMLWGGLLMMVAQLFTLVFINKESKQVASVIGGVGFGMFIDELGKFITKDNNYFYQPTVALIYVLFVLILLAIRHSEKYFPITPKVYAVNSLELAKEAVLEDLDEQEHQKLIQYINLSDPKNPFNADLKDIVKKLQRVKDPAPGLWTNTRTRMKQLYTYFVTRKGFTNTIITISIIYFFVGVGLAVWNLGERLSFSTVGELFFSLIATWYALQGIKHILERDRLEAFEDLKKGVTVSIFLTQFFLYLSQQLWATFGLVFNLLAFMVIKYLIDQELMSKENNE